MLLKSCAMPPASWPTASSFCDCRSCSSRRLRSVMSSQIPSKQAPPSALKPFTAEIAAQILFPLRVASSASSFLTKPYLFILRAIAARLALSTKKSLAMRPVTSSLEEPSIMRTNALFTSKNPPSSSSVSR